jgi:hypothetical protein
VSRVQEMLEIRHQLIGKVVGNHRDQELENKNERNKMRLSVRAVRAGCVVWPGCGTCVVSTFVRPHDRTSQSEFTAPFGMFGVGERAES